MQLNKLASAIEKLQGRFIGAQAHIHPLLYFLVLVWIQMSGKEMPAVLTITFGVISTCSHGINSLFMFSPWSREAPLSFLLLLPCLLSCTSREKLSLFSLAFTRSCFTEETPRMALLFLWSLVIACMVLKQLCFPSERENRFYFIGFCITAAYSALELMKIMLSKDINLLLEVILLVAISSLGVELMGRRLTKLMGSKPQSLKYEGQMRIYMENMSQMLGNTVLSQTVMMAHKKLCERVDCFCSRDNSSMNGVAFLKQLYDLFLARLQGRDDGLIRQKYIQFHLEQSQIINAVWELKKCQSKSYFQSASIIRMYQKINTWNKHANSGNVFGRQFEYGEKFDGILMQFAKKAVDVIKLKKRFWRELGREYPRVGLLQRTGNEAVQSMYDLNEYYAREVRVKEQKLSLLDGTALYAVYLLSTTNFREYAESLIKASAKTMEEARLFDCAQSETYAVSAQVHSPSLSLLENTKTLSMDERQLKHNKQLIIRSISLGLCRTLGYEKEEVLGKELSTIIPMGYKEVHNVRLSMLLNFNSNRSVTPSKILHRELSLPMKGAGNRIVVGKILIKIHPNSKSELSFISVVRLLNTRTKSALLDSKGNATQFQDGFDESLLQHSEVQRYYGRAIESWFKEGYIIEERFNIVVNASNYSVCMSCPLLVLFIDKGKLVQAAPPIHVEITNQVSNRRVRTDRDGRIGNQFNKMEAVLNLQAGSSTASSKSSASAVNILSAFSQNYSTVYYRLLQGIFLAAMLICAGCSIGAHYSSGLQWISSWQANNPINDTMNLYSLHMLTVKMLLVKSNLDTYDNSSINKTTVDSYFPHVEYTNYSVLETLNIENAFKSSIYNCLKSQSVLKQSMKQKLQKMLGLSNPYTFSQLGAARLTYQQLSYLEILMLIATDANLIAKRKYSIFGSSYSVQISQWQNSTNFQLLIHEKIANSANLSLTLHCVFIGTVVALIIPLFCLLRKRAQEHTVVFDILASVDSGMTSKEVDSLNYVQNIIINFKEADQTLKNNVLDYQVNALMPKGTQKRRASAENELVIGLEEYDRAYERRSKYDSFDSRLSSREKHTEKTSFLTFVRKGFNKSVKQPRTLRRRDGQIDLKDSWMDSSKKVIASHVLLYVLVGISAICLLLGLIMNRYFTNALQQAKTLLFALFQQQVGIYNIIVTNKILTTHGADFTSKFFGIPDVLNMLIVPLNQYFPYFDYTHDFPVPQVPQCQGTTYQKLCQFRTNQIILKSQLGSVLKDIVQLRYNYDRGDIPANWSREQIYSVIKQKDFYVDSIAYKLQEIAMQQISYISDRINEEAILYSSRKNILLVLGVVWVVLATIIGLWVILRQKQRYFREVFLITFLNREMIAKNKRVESFLERLARSNGV